MDEIPYECVISDMESNVIYVFEIIQNMKLRT